MSDPARAAQLGRSGWWRVGAVRYVAAHEKIGATVPGDFVLTHGSGLVHKAIRLAQRIRFRGKRRPFAYWNHAALIVGEEGEIIEAQSRYGVRRSNLNQEYLAREYTVVQIAAIETDRQQEVAFAEACLGQDYGFLTIVSLLAWVIFGGKLFIGLDGTEICSGLVAQALVRTGMIFTRGPSMMMPADLAEYFDVRWTTGGVRWRMT